MNGLFIRTGGPTSSALAQRVTPWNNSIRLTALRANADAGG